jgi:DNA-binding CsgD family transcriptional regulator
MRQPSHAVSDVVMPSLTDWGISVDADLMYRCLFTFGARTAAALERDLGISRRRVADGLDELASVQAAVAQRRGGRRGVMWVASPPSEVIAALRRHRPRRTGRGQRPGERRPLIEQVLAGPMPLGKGLRHLPSRALTRTRLAELVRVVRHEHLAMSPEPAYEAESVRSAVPLDRALLNRGVQMRILGAQPLGEDPLARYGRRPDEPLPDYREAASVPSKLIIMDRRIALFPVKPDDLDRGYLEVFQESVVRALTALFEEHWAAADTLREARMTQVPLTVRERDLVTLLAAGHTDATAARELRISQRSVSSAMRQLMDRLGVDNRFQLGLALGALHVQPSAADPQQPTVDVLR